MKANELRIGNYVMYKNPDYNNIPYIIDYTSKPNTVGLERVSVNRIPYNQIQPIPLTEEWLLKFGFINNKYLDEMIFSHPIHSICYDIEDFTVRISDSWEFGNNIKSVHQLQNLYFALTGEELTIK